MAAISRKNRPNLATTTPNPIRQGKAGQDTTPASRLKYSRFSGMYARSLFVSSGSPVEDLTCDHAAAAHASNDASNDTA